MTGRQRRMVGHGAMIMIIGLVAGFGLVMALIGGFEVFPGTILDFEIPGDSDTWARAHVGGLLNGIMVLVVAAVLWGLRIPERDEGRVAWMFIGAGYANSVFYWGALFADNRAVTLGDNRHGDTSVAAVLAFTPAFVFAFITLVGAGIVAKHAFRSASGADGVHSAEVA